ncbi:hypothetical protein N134_05760 [Limosilactobacillus reuteri TD1]|uniref:Uncharacterized protein n=3 Tax=Limosilactobacillus reuteri TaxID=1598 RepID=S5NS22_LIMRT|nr:hypothetical protein [Limosilactobacillus reuteri]AGR65195.1 hypothetical protein N134_05760 [Limosilactobacillus reuteri TD1]MRG75620.1 hypothetical protein [Limosilactobacillus reuteri]OUL53720.1 hypothetical protein B2G46_05760 [Limosilactobacillus reuteri]
MRLDTYNKEIFENTVKILSKSEDSLNFFLDPETYHWHDDEKLKKNMRDAFDLEKITEINIYHWTNFINKPIELLPLKDLLTSKNDLSKFFEEYGYIFQSDDKKLKIIKQGKQFGEEELKKMNENKAFPLISRLERDFCINGVFPGNEANNSPYSINLVPEIIKDIDETFGEDSKLINAFQERAQHYLVIVNVPIDLLIIDGTSALYSNEEKRVELLFKALSSYYYEYGKCEPINIRLPDFSKVKIDKVISCSD